MTELWQLCRDEMFDEVRLALALIIRFFFGQTALMEAVGEKRHNSIVKLLLDQLQKFHN